MGSPVRVRFSMPSALRRWAANMYAAAEKCNVENMCRILREWEGDKNMLDLGCGDGHITAALASALGATAMVGVECDPERAALARLLGVQAVVADLDKGFPFEDASFGVVTSNQVIEHVCDTDLFVAEMARVLRPGGLALVSTENLASWHNILALLIGFAPFSTINYSRYIYPLGNPLSIHAGSSSVVPDSLGHRRVFTVPALRELFVGHGFAVRRVYGAGYYPLPPSLGRVDVRHAHFITVHAHKRP